MGKNDFATIIVVFHDRFMNHDMSKEDKWENVSALIGNLPNYSSYQYNAPIREMKEKHWVMLIEMLNNLPMDH